MKHILVLSYAVSPFRGSEYAVAWNYICRMSEDHRLTVLYGTSGEHLGDMDEMQQFLLKNPVSNVSFHPVSSTPTIDFLNLLNKKGIFPYSFYIAFGLWQKEVLKHARKIVAADPVDVVHMLNPIGYREPGELWRLDLPYIWGPVGGTLNVPAALFDVLPVKGKLMYGLRNVLNTMQFQLNRRLRKVLKHTDVLIASTTADQQKFISKYQVACRHLPENGIVSYHFKEESKQASPLQLIWIGRIDAGKALSFLLEALQQMKHESGYVLHVIGNGPLKPVLEERFAGLKERVRWHGQIPREEVFRRLADADLHILTSIKEANTTVVFEAMGHGVPTLTLDHCGMHDTVCTSCGIKIPVESHTQIVGDIAHALDHLLDTPAELQRLKAGVKVCATRYDWDARKQFFNEMYDEAISLWKERIKK